MRRIPIVPASFFGIAGLGNGWRVASRIWNVPAWIGESISALAALIWFVTSVLYIAKWWLASEQAWAEFRHLNRPAFGEPPLGSQTWMREPTNQRRERKNPLSNSLASPASTPPCTSKRWLWRSC
jgi:hypothetical protein